MRLPSQLTACLLLFLLAVQVLSSQLDLQSTHDGVTRLSGTPMFKQAINDGRIHFIQFSMPHQGASQRLAPLWKDLAAQNRVVEDERIAIDLIDCSDEDNLRLCQNLPEYPLFKIYEKGKDRGTYKGEVELNMMTSYIVGAARFYQPKGNWFVQKVKMYTQFVLRAFQAKPRSERLKRKAKMERVRNNELKWGDERRQEL